MIKEPATCPIINFGGWLGLCNVQYTPNIFRNIFKCPFGTDTRAKINKYQHQWGPVSRNTLSLLNDSSDRPTDLQRNIWRITKSQILCVQHVALCKLAIAAPKLKMECHDIRAACVKSKVTGIFISDDK